MEVARQACYRRSASWSKGGSVGIVGNGASIFSGTGMEALPHTEGDDGDRSVLKLLSLIPRLNRVMNLGPRASRNEGRPRRTPLLFGL